MKSSVACALSAVGGFAGGLVITSGLSASDSIFDEGTPSWHVLFDSSTALGAAVAVIAVIVAAAVYRRHAPASVLAGLGLVIVAAVAAAGPDPLAAGRFNAVGAGFLLGGLCVLSVASGSVWNQTWLTTGVLAGVTVAPSLEVLRIGARASSADTSIVWAVLIPALLGLVLVGLVVVLKQEAAPVRDDGRSWRVIALTIALSGSSVVLYWWWVTGWVRIESPSAGIWMFGFVVVAVAIVGSLLLRGQSGIVLLAVVAYLSSRANMTALTEEGPMVVAVVILMIGGGALGRRSPLPLVGVGIMAVCAATGFVDGFPRGVDIAIPMVIAVTAGYTVAACLPSAASSTAMALTSPAVLVIGIGLFFRAIAYTGDTAGGSQVMWSDAATGVVAVSTLSVVACGLAIAYLRRRPNLAG